MAIPDWLCDYYLLLWGSVPEWMLPSITLPPIGPTKVYILAGQSNATGASLVADLTPEQLAPPEGWSIYLDGTAIPAGKQKRWIALTAGLGVNDAYFGPELPFAKSMGNPPSCLIKYTAPGTSMATFWRSPSSGGARVGYVKLLRTIRDGLASLQRDGCMIAGIIWMQGEADAVSFDDAPPYGTRLICFVNDLRKALNCSPPVVIGKIHLSPIWPFGYVVRWQQDLAVSMLKRTDSVETDDLPLQATNPHFSSQGEYTLGERFAAKIRVLTSKFI